MSSLGTDPQDEVSAVSHEVEGVQTELHRPHPQPEAQGAAQAGEQLREGERRVE